MKFLRVILAVVLAVTASIPAVAGTVTGKITTATSGPIANGVLTFTLTQAAVQTGTATIVSSPVQCFTDAQGNAVGEPNPLVIPTVNTQVGVGTLSAGTYYTVIAYSDSTGTTYYSPEATTILAAQGSLIVTAPTKQPSGATSYKVFIGSTSGGETLQQTVTVSPGSWPNYTQSTSLSAGAALPASNTTVCTILFNDQLMPSFTGYSVTLTTSNSVPYSGWPQKWYLYGGASGTINLSNGTPFYSGVVTYPQAIVTTPAANGVQSISGDLSLGTHSFAAGAGTFKSQQGLAIVYADQYTNVSTAITACPASGCTVDARSPNVALALGTIDPGTKAVTLLLGPYSYTADHIVLRNNLRIIGVGGGNSSSNATIITSVGANAQPLIVIPQANSTSAQHVHIEAVNFVGLAGNTSQDSLFADCSALTNSGLWYSDFENLNFSGFAGVAIHLKGPSGSSASVNQFLTFKNVYAKRSAAAAVALKIEGANGQMTFNQTEFDGTGISLSGTNIFIGTTGGTTESPYSIHFTELTTQGSDVGVTLDGVSGIVFDNLHAESLHGAISLASTGQLINGVSIVNSVFFGTVGVNAGNGYIVKSTASSQFGVVVKNNFLGGTPDNVYTGPNNQGVDFADNVYIGSAGSNPPSAGGTTQLAPAATLNIQSFHTVGLNASGTSITTIQSSMLPGERVTFIALGQCQFATGGNIDLTGVTSPLILATGETATFVRNDLSGTWRFVATTTAILTGKTLVSPTINTGVSQGSGHKHQRFGGLCTTGAVAGNNCTTAVTWTNAFADANYTVSCTGLTSSNVPNLELESIAGAGFTIRIFAVTAAAATYATVDCIADHD